VWSPRRPRGGGLGGLTVSRNVDGTATLTGSLTDQAELRGVLARLCDLGITLVALTSTPPSPTVPTVPTDKE
jgi:hypothetical protein